MTPTRFLRSHSASAAAAATLLALTVANARGESPPKADAVAIKSILPHDRVGEDACFEGTFSGRMLDMEDWAHTTTKVVPGLEVGGTPATRPVPGPLPDQDVSRITLHLSYTDRQDDGAFDYAFTVMAASKSLSKKLFAHSGCAWSEREERLACWIECDGGGMSVERIAGTEGLSVSFSNLSMQAGCDGGGAYRIGTGDRADDISFRLESVPLRACKPLKAWAEEQ